MLSNKQSIRTTNEQKLLLLEVEKFININRWYKYKNNKFKNNVFVLTITESSSVQINNYIKKL